MSHVCISVKKEVIVFQVLYVNILLIGNNVRMLSVEIWLSSQFDIQDLGKASYVLGIKVTRDRQDRTIRLS